MLQLPNRLHHPKILLISAIAVSLAACSPGGENNTRVESPTSPIIESSASPISSATPSIPTDVETSAALPGVNTVEEINFKSNNGNVSNGFFDSVNDSTEKSHEVSRKERIKVGGWALIPEEGRTADRVIITVGENNSVVAVTPLDLEREDVAKNLKNPGLSKSGWITAFNASKLPTDKVVLNAWAYNAATKTATQLSPAHEIILKE